MRNGGQILIAQLAINGLQRVFTVPGESFVSALDALRDCVGMEVVTTRHEGSAAMMAEATARLAGPAQPAAGVAIVTRGPGLANAMSGLHVAMQSATGMLLLVGLPPRKNAGRRGFQDVGLEGLVGAFAKHIEMAATAERIPEIIARSLVIAHSGRAGPVVVGLPEDVLYEQSDVQDAEPVVLARPQPSHDDMMRFAKALDEAEWPIVIAGGRWRDEARTQLAAFAQRLDLPVVTSFRSQDAIDNRLEVYCGHAGLSPSPKLKAALSSADLIVAIGTHLDEVTVGGYETVATPTPRQRLVHVYPDAAEIGRNHHTEIGIVSAIEPFAARLDDLLPSIRLGMLQRWSRLRQDLRAVHEAWGSFAPSAGQLRLEDVIVHISHTLPDDAIVTNGAGNYAAYLHRCFTYKGPQTQLAPLSGSMGYGLPAAIAAKLASPEREVVALAGDGCFQMTGQDLATAVQYGAPIIVIVANNRSLGTIRAAQERRFPGRPIATSLINPDFAALAVAMGAQGYRVQDIDEFKECFANVRNGNDSALIELLISPNALSPGHSI